MHDTLSDFLTRIRNAGRARHATVRMPHSVFKERVAALLISSGYLEGMSVKAKTADRPYPELILSLRYDRRKECAIRGVEVVSRPGHKVYSGYRDIKPFFGGVGTTILSTPKGVLTDAQAREFKVGGEVICRVW